MSTSSNRSIKSILYVSCIIITQQLSTITAFQHRYHPVRQHHSSLFSPFQTTTTTSTSTSTLTQPKNHHHQQPPSLSPYKTNFRTDKTSLADVSGWRDLFFEDVPKPPVVEDVLRRKTFEGPAREVCVFPFPLEDVLIQGETKELCLYEERFHRLFEHAQTHHESVVAMGLIAPPSGILQTLPLCEIEAYRRMPGQTQFGTPCSIYVTIRAVGRATLLHITEDIEDERGFLKGWCVEVEDGCKGWSEGTGDALVDRLEIVLEEVNQLEERIVELEEMEMGLNDDYNDEEEHDDKEYDDDEDDEDEDDFSNDNRLKRFQRAYRTAKSTDTKGYKTITTTTTTTNNNNIVQPPPQRSIQDLTALSWAYFCTEANSEDALVYRLRAMECDDTNERLGLALRMLNERRSTLKSLTKNERGVSGEEEE